MATEMTDTPPQPLDEFTPFPRLPIELREKIFKYALPNQGNEHWILAVEGHVRVVDEEFGVYLNFDLSNKYSTTFYEELSDEESFYFSSRSVVLSQVCQESRNIFLKSFPNILPAEQRMKSPYISYSNYGKFRFNDTTIIHIVNFDDLLGDTHLYDGSLQGFRLQRFWSQIRRVAISITTFGDWWDLRSIPFLVETLAAFKNLELLILECHSLMDWGAEQDLKTFVKALKTKLDEQSKKLQLTQKVPEVRICGAKFLSDDYSDEDDDDENNPEDEGESDGFEYWRSILWP